MRILALSNRKTWIILGTLFYSMPALFAGGWPQGKGMAYLKLYQWWVIADQHYTDAGKIDPNVTNGLFNTTFYGEYGLTERLTVVASVPVFSRAYFNNTVSGTTGEVLTPGEAINGIGDFDFGIKYGLINNGNLAVSSTLTLGIPMGNASGGSAGNLQTGDGEFNQTIQVDAGKGFKLGKLPAYANVYAGFNNRTNGFSDELRYGFEMGAQFFNQKIWVIGRLYGVESLQNGDPQNGANSTSIFANNSEHLTFSPEISWLAGPNWGFAASVGAALSGQIIFAAPSYSFGVFLNL